jgi:NAD(P)-dependent dehydrogenase (short-subunit alcohol dehydrogenase family)
MALGVDLAGRTILVCGVAQGGIGGATVRQIVKAGGRVIALDKDDETIAPTIDDAEALGGKVDAFVADLYDVTQCQTVIATALDRFGAIDGIANVAGGTRADEWVPLPPTRSRPQCS